MKKQENSTIIEFPTPKSIFDVDFKIISDVKNPDSIMPIEFLLTTENKKPYFVRLQGYKKRNNLPQYPIVNKFSELIGKRTMEEIDKDLGAINKIEILDSELRKYIVFIEELD